MTLHSLICPSCNGQIDTFDENAMTGKCPFCGSLIMDIPELQNKFKLDSQGRMMVSGIEGSDELFDRLQANIRFKDISKAKKLAHEFTEKYPTEFRGWQTLCDINLNDVLSRTQQNSDVEMAVQRMRILAKSPDERAYLAELKKRLVKRKKTIDAQIGSLQAHLPSAESAYDAAMSANVAQQKKRTTAANKSSDAGGVGCVLGFVGFFVIMGALTSVGIDQGNVFVLSIAGAITLGIMLTKSRKSTLERANNIAEQTRQTLSKARDDLNGTRNNLSKCSNFSAYLGRVVASI